jgi:Zn-dependent protease with chaperone function
MNSKFSKNFTKGLFAALTLAAVASACGPAASRGPLARDGEVALIQAELRAEALRYELRQRKRVTDIARRLIRAVDPRANRASSRPYLGLEPVRTHGAAERVFGQEAAPGGVYIGFVPGVSPAREAGLRAGDVLLSVNGREIGSPEDLDSAVRGLVPGQAAVLGLWRSGEFFEVSAGVETLPVDVRFELVNKAKVDAISSRGRIRIYYGMLRFCESDEELAMLLAHELSHHVLGHTRNVPLITLGGAFNGKIYRDVEREADYLGARLLFAAGFDVEAGARFYERYAVETAGGLKGGLFYTHPFTAERIARIRRAIAGLKSP